MIPSKGSESNFCHAINLGIPRCASTSLRSFCKSNKIQFATGREEGYWGKASQKSTINFSIKFAEHLSKKHEENWSNMFSFACVRDPFTRAISIMHHDSWAGTVNGNFELFCELLINKKYPSKYAQWHAMSPYYHLFDTDGNQLIDYIWKMEEFESGLKYISERLSINNSVHYHKRNSAEKNPNKRPYLSFYSKATLEMIENIYSNDLKHFNYNVPEKEFNAFAKEC